MLEKATPGDLDTAEDVTQDYYECPACDGQGELEATTFINLDGDALGVQFFGVGHAFVNQEELWRVARPLLPALLSDLEALQAENERLKWLYTDAKEKWNLDVQEFAPRATRAEAENERLKRQLAGGERDAQSWAIQAARAENRAAARRRRCEIRGNAMTDDLSPENLALIERELPESLLLKHSYGFTRVTHSTMNRLLNAARSDELADTKDEGVAQVVEMLLDALMTQKHFVLRCAQKLYGRAASNASSWACNADAPWRIGKDFLAMRASAPPSSQPDELAAKDAEIAKLKVLADETVIRENGLIIRTQAAEAQRDALLDGIRSILALPYPKAKDVRHPIDVIAILARARIIARDACTRSEA